MTVEACEGRDELAYPVASSIAGWLIDNILHESEQLLIAGDYSGAERGLTQAIALCGESQDDKIRLCRSLFNRSLVAASVGAEESALNDLNALSDLVMTFQCNTKKTKINDVFLAGGKPILGEDEITVEECLQRTERTVGYIKDLLALAPVSIKWKASFIAAIYLLEDKAFECCRSGGVWKACLQPLLHKWITLKEWEKECSRSGHWYLQDI